MRIVWKEPIIAPEFTIQAGEVAPVHVGLDGGGNPCVWYEHNPAAASLGLVSCRVFGTGHPIEEPWWSHLGSYVHEGFVWHVYYRVMR